ncbi:calpain-7-like [Hetaerina americana]|uniref:calpain-7-like n=1 Tax=Hetaerina americana TaxID=62018 RepID=UPI003A7F228C
MSWNVKKLVEDALVSSTRAVQFDRNGNFEVASYYYMHAARQLALASDSQNPESESWKEKADQYIERALVLDKLRLGKNVTPAMPQGYKELQRAHYLFQEALDADEAGNEEEAVELYSQAVEMSISATNSTSDVNLKHKLTHLAKKALERAEELKGIKDPPEKSPTSHHAVSFTPLPSFSRTSGVPPGETVKPLASGSQGKLHRGSSVHLVVSGGQESYSEEEKRVLLSTSLINGVEYVPFMSVDLGERFRYPVPFSDRDGSLRLSPKQKKSFARWARPDEIYPEPRMIALRGKGDTALVDCFSIKQTVVSDCSFVASLAVSALYERRFGKKLIISILYPRNSKGDPIYNPFGKYMVKLHINGIPRKVIVDDTLPVGHHGELLCSYSTNRGELWISILEKAYMKVMGGYDFPGSNSNIDLHALTGWIPERCAIRPSDPEFNKDAIFDKLNTRHRKGDVLITVATGELSDAESDRTGLVSTHAYAVLDIREVKGIRLLQLKNPWSHLRWRGNYSELDVQHWTDEMKSILNFDPNSAAMFDNGVFWIDYDSICRFFDVFYLNWNPALFNYTYCIHQSWKAGIGPIKDVYNVGENPQFSLEVQMPPSASSAAVWILLTRHITLLEDFKENQEYITVLVYKTEGKRVYYPGDPPPFIDGIRINSPHYLCKIVLNEKSSRRYTLVMSQYEKMNTIFYTLRTYSTCPFTMKKIGNPYVHTKTGNGEWKGKTAGGCANHHNTHMNNPRYQITLETSSNSNDILLDLKGPKQYQIGMDVICVVANDPKAPGYFQRKSSGPFRPGFVILEMENVPAGTYDIIPSTFLPDQEGPFILTVKSSCTFKIARLQ